MGYIGNISKFDLLTKMCVELQPRIGHPSSGGRRTTDVGSWFTFVLSCPNTPDRSGFFLIQLLLRIIHANIGRRKRERPQKPCAGVKPRWHRMGNESSIPVADNVPPATLKERTLKGVVDYVKERNVRRVVVIVSCSYTFNPSSTC